MPINYGGGQEKNLRSGTENLNAIVGFGKACQLMLENHKEENEYIKGLKNYFTKKIVDNIQDIKINSPRENASDYILNISFLNTRGEVILHYLEDKDIYVSTSSACSSNGTDKSHVLKSIGLKDREIEGAIRFCFSYENTKADLDKVVEVLSASVREIRQIILR